MGITWHYRMFASKLSSVFWGEEIFSFYLFFGVGGEYFNFIFVFISFLVLSALKSVSPTHPLVLVTRTTEKLRR